MMEQRTSARLTTVVEKYFENKFFGKLLEKEVLALKRMNNGASPILAVLGPKISSNPDY